MGKTKNEKQKAIKLIAQLQGIVDENDQRLSDFHLSLEHALNERKKKRRLYLLSRLRDEMHGYYIRIYQSISSANTLECRQNPKKDLKKLDQYINENQYISETLNKMKLSRNQSAHPDAYYVNTHSITSNKEIITVAKDVQDALIKTTDINDLDIYNEKESQKNNLERKHKKTLEFIQTHNVGKKVI